MILFGSVSGSYFSIGFESYMNFSIILNINFTFVFPTCKFVMLHILTNYKLSREILKIEHFCLVRNCQILSVFQISDLFRIRSYPDSELPGSGMIFPDPYPDPAESLRSERIRIHNTGRLRIIVAPSLPNV